jgi:hypothetical protein
MDHPARVHRYFAAMRCQHCLQLVVIPALLWSGCRKDADGTPPSVRITSPGAAFTVVMPDTVTVVAEISDDQDIESVTFSIENEQGFPVTEAITIEPSSNAVTLTVSMPLTSDAVLSGPHEVKVVAIDGVGRGTASRMIDVVAIPRRVRGLYVLTRPGSDQVALHRIDSLGVLGLVNTIDQDLHVSGIGSKGQRLYLGGSTTGPLRSLFPDNGQTLAQVANLNTLLAPYFTALQVTPEGTVFAATNDGQLHRFGKDLNGTGYQADALVNYRIDKVLELENAVLTAQSSVASADLRLVQYSPIGGAQTDVRVLDKVPVELFIRDADHVLLFGNRNGEGVVEDRNVTDGGYWEPRVFPEPLRSVVRIDENVYILGVGTEIIRFTYSNAGAIPIASGISADHLAYNEVTGELVVADGQTVIIMDAGNGTTIDSYTLPQGVVGLLPLYNR